MTKSNVELGIKAYVFSRSGVCIVKLEDKRLFYLKAGSVTDFGPYNLTVTRDKYPPGEYSVRAILLSMGLYSDLGYRKGQEIAKATRRFYVEEDPPERGLFEDWDPVEYPQEANHIIAYADLGERGGYRLSYNTKHPAKKACDSNEDTLTDYLVMAGATQIPRIAVRQDDLPDEVMDLLGIQHIKELDDPETLYRAHSTIFGKVMQAYYSG